jgi:predicted oxidoreductase
MQRIRLTSSGPELSRLCLGTWRLRDDPSAATPQGFLTLLRTALDLGITTIDTAEIYGLYRVEEIIGQALALDAGVKSRVEIVSKAGIYVPCEFHPERKTAFYNTSADRLVKSAEKSLRLIGRETLDLFLVHRPDWLTRHEETADGIDRLLRAGKILAAGVSNYTPAQFRALSAFVAAPLVTNQVQFSPFCLDPVFDGTFDQCQELGLHPMAWSPTGGGRLFKDDDEAGARVRQVLTGLAGKYGGAGLDALCYAWILAHGSSPFVVTGTNKSERLRSLSSSRGISLEREDWYAITEAARGRRIP